MNQESKALAQELAITLLAHPSSVHSPPSDFLPPSAATSAPSATTNTTATAQLTLKWSEMVTRCPFSLPNCVCCQSIVSYLGGGGFKELSGIAVGAEFPATAGPIRQCGPDDGEVSSSLHSWFAQLSAVSSFFLRV